jgi:hypothetical protein
MDGRLQRLFAALNGLFNPPLVITLQRSVRKKRFAAQNSPQGWAMFSMHRRDFFGFLDRHWKAYSLLRS